MRSLNTSAERLKGVLDITLLAGRVLTSSGDLRNALAQIANAIVENLGDYCEIELDGAVPEQGDLRVVAGTMPSEQVEEGFVVEQLSDGRRGFGWMRCLLAASDRSDGVLREALRILASSLGVLLRSRSLMVREHQVADRLQRALLPERLPPVAGAELHAAYRPASHEAEVGGDWFDAFDLSDGRIAISVGDVAGHGLESAVVMGEVRLAIRTAAVGTQSAAAVLSHVNRMILLRQSLHVVTAIFAIYDTATSQLTYATAGHPSPLVALRGGPVKALPSSGLPLGCIDALECHEWTFTVPDDARVIFYTDGLIENDRDIIAGERRLLDSARDLFCSSTASVAELQDPASALQERMFGGLANRDDTAVLILLRKDPVPDFVFSAVPVAAALARATISRKLVELGVASECRFDILTALGEAVANAVEHAYRGADPGLVRLELAQEGSHLVLSVEDFGRWQPFIRRGHRGRGFEMMHAFMDGVQIQSAREYTRILLKKDIAS